MGTAARRRSLAFVTAVLIALAACSRGDGRAPGARGVPDARPGLAEGLPDMGTDSPSLSDPGRRLATTTALFDRAPRYHLDALVEPETGKVEADVVASLPAGSEPLRFRVFPNLAALDAGFHLSRVEVDGRAVEPDLDRSVLTLERPTDGSGQRVEVAMTFSYTVPVTDLATDPSSVLGGDGSGLDPAEIGLLGRHGGGLSLGHWFPVWLTPGAEAEPEPDGFGDIANFPAANFTARLDVPAGWQLFSGGVNTDRRQEPGRTISTEEGVGLRDLAIYLGRDLATEEVEVGGTTVRVVSQAGNVDVLGEVGEESSSALSILADAFGPYPWSELDVIDVPLGSGVGGMEWPGAIWIETATFGGGIPGLSGLEGLLGGGDSSGGEASDGLEGLLGEVLGGGAAGSLRSFIVAHEVAHQWWHALVGNDSITAPVVDEPLAQFSACHYLRVRSPQEGDEHCALHTEGQYRALRGLGQPDAPAAQATDQFSSSLQYGAVVYGKAPGFYEKLSDLIGQEALLGALRSYVEANAFAIATPEDLRGALRAAAPGRAEEVDALWVRWLEQAHGDEDIGTGAPLGGLGALGGLEGLLGGSGALEGLVGGGDAAEVDPAELEALLTKLLEDLSGR